MRVTAILAVLSVFLAQEPKDPPFKKDYPQDGIYWAKAWIPAIEEAKHRHVPIHYVIHNDEFPTCLDMLKVYADKRVIEASRAWVNVAANPYDKHMIEADLDRMRIRTCERFWNIKCSSHVEAFIYTREYKELDDPPLTVFTKPGFIELDRVNGRMDATELLAEMKRVLGKWPGNRLTAGEWREVKPILDEGDRRFKDGHWRWSIDTYSKLKDRPQERAKELCQIHLDKVNVQGDMQFAEADRMNTKGKGRAEALKRLRQIVKDFKPLPCSVKAEKKIKQIENDDNPPR